MQTESVGGCEERSEEQEGCQLPAGFVAVWEMNERSSTKFKECGRIMRMRCFMDKDAKTAETDALRKAQFVDGHKFHSSLLKNPDYGHARNQDHWHSGQRKRRHCNEEHSCRDQKRSTSKEQALGDRSKDHQELEYTYGSAIYAVEESFVNSSCDPNCENWIFHHAGYNQQQVPTVTIMDSIFSEIVEN